MPSDLTGYGKHYLDESDIDSVIQVLRHNFLTCGPAVEEFESSLSTYVGASNAVSCSNGTAALHMATRLSVQPGQAAIVPSITFLATANAIRYNGGRVIFSDVNPDSGLMEPEHFEKALLAAGDDRVTTVIPVHLCGQSTDMEPIASIARQRSITIIEDACHALGSEYRGASGASSRVGSCCFSDMTIFSFHPVKNISTGEGGAILCNNEALAVKLRRMRSHGMLKDPELLESVNDAFDANGLRNPWYYEMQELGFNYRLSDIQAALGCSQLKKLNTFVKKREALKKYYDELIVEYAPQLKSINSHSSSKTAWHLYSVLIEFDQLGTTRSNVMRALKEKGIGTQVHYFPVHRQPYYQKENGKITLPGAERYYQRTLSLPLFYEMSFEDIDYIVASLVEVLGIQ